VTQEKTISNRKFIPALTGLRTICAYGIFFYHTGVVKKENYPVLYIIINQFYSFIPFFFVISAFVIIYSYYKPSGYTKNEFYNYFINRFARIFPILIILNTLVFLLLYRGHIYTAGKAIKLYLLNITLLKGFSSEYILTGVAPSWTNSVEEVFYVLAPVLFLLATKRFFLIRATLFSYIAGILFTSCLITFPLFGFLSSFKFTAYYTFFGRAFEFTCGIYLALLFKGVYTNSLLEKISKSTIYIGVGLLILCYTSLYLIASHYHVEHANETWAGIAVNNFAFPVAIFFILYSLLYQKSLLQKFLSTRLMVSLGNATYSFYLLHTTFILSYIYKYISTNIFISFICMVAISFVFYKLVEQPVAKFLKVNLYRKEIVKIKV